MKSRTPILVSALICALAIGVFVLPKKRGTPQLETVTVATFSKALGNSPYHIAKHFRWIEEEGALKGVTIVHKLYNDRPSISDAFSSGELQVLFSAEVPSILCRAQGNDI